MKFSYYKYTLVPKSSMNRNMNNTREGCLFRFEFKDFGYGYADCCPIPQWGDPGVEQIISILKEHSVKDAKSLLELPAVLQRSLYWAQIDGKARFEKRDLFSDVEVKNHSLITDVLNLEPEEVKRKIERSSGYIKLKFGRDIDREITIFSDLVRNYSDITWRIDFNQSGGQEFLEKLPQEMADKIDFIEDPEPFESELWKKLEQKYTVKLALDQRLLGQSWPLQIYKPMRDIDSFRPHDVVTHSMDHPLGQSVAYYVAQSNTSKYHGVNGASLFEENFFSERIVNNSQCFYPDRNYGFGFDDLLKDLNWKTC